jgi:hypothetical protein
MNTPVERPLFIAQDKLTQWESEGKVTVQGSVLTLVAEKRAYQLQEAVRFLKVLGNDADAQGLVGRVRTREQLKQMKAEHYMGSVILGDLGYEVQEGFVGSVVHPPGSPPVRTLSAVVPVPVVPPKPPVPDVTLAAVAAPPPAKPAPASPPQTDAQLLADFLLSNLTG